MELRQQLYRMKLRHARAALAPKEKALTDRMLEVELGFDRETGYQETQRCLNCDVQTVFTANKCIECDACVDICPTRCITFTAPAEDERRFTSTA
jgi:formate dehydrogenase beta subunit